MQPSQRASFGESELPSDLLADPRPVIAVAHDLGPPQALVDFMLTDWAAGSASAAPIAGSARFAARRAALSAAFPGDVLIVPTGGERTRANDTAYRFRPGSDFYYLTGNLEPDCVVVFMPTPSGHEVRIFVDDSGKSDATFFTDRAKGELWTGRRAGVRESAVRFGMTAHALPEFPEFVARLRLTDRTRVRELPDPATGTVADNPLAAELAQVLSEMRLIKDDHEIAELEAAIAATARGFEDVLRALPHSKTERYVEGVFGLRARVDGNDVGYGTIAAAGVHACTLHWTANDGPLVAGDLLLLDAGVEATTLYTADVTRTIPLSGRFSREQREIYELVLAAQDAGFAACAPGNDFLAPNVAAMTVLAHGLERLGILSMSAEEALVQTNQFYRRYSLHNVSHMLGLDVHDCARARAETYKFGKLEAGMVLTVEPGLYFQPDDLTVPERYRGIGVRIEDDVVITNDGYRNLSAALPRAADDVERWVASCAARGYALP